jgi:hypothetical protein
LAATASSTDATAALSAKSSAPSRIIAARVSGSDVFVTDAVSAKQASVNTGGQIATVENVPTAVIGTGSVSVPANGSGVLFLTTSVTAYRDIRIFVTQTGAQNNRQVVSLIAKAGNIQSKPRHGECRGLSVNAGR